MIVFTVTVTTLLSLSLLSDAVVMIGKVVIFLGLDLSIWCLQGVLAYMYRVYNNVYFLINLVLLLLELYLIIS